MGCVSEEVLTVNLKCFFNLKENKLQLSMSYLCKYFLHLSNSSAFLRPVAILVCKIIVW